jgi:hypothetical protein
MTNKAAREYVEQSWVRELIERTTAHNMTLPDGWCQIKTAFYKELLEERKAADHWKREAEQAQLVIEELSIENINLRAVVKKAGGQ